jgi:hypothetical protein
MPLGGRARWRPHGRRLHGGTAVALGRPPYDPMAVARRRRTRGAAAHSAARAGPRAPRRAAAWRSAGDAGAPAAPRGVPTEATGVSHSPSPSSPSALPVSSAPGRSRWPSASESAGGSVRARPRASAPCRVRALDGLDRGGGPGRDRTPTLGGEVPVEGAAPLEAGAAAPAAWRFARRDGLGRGPAHGAPGGRPAGAGGAARSARRHPARAAVGAVALAGPRVPVNVAGRSLEATRPRPVATGARVVNLVEALGWRAESLRRIMVSRSLSPGGQMPCPPQVHGTAGGARSGAVGRGRSFAGGRGRGCPAKWQTTQG